MAPAGQQSKRKFSTPLETLRLPKHLQASSSPRPSMSSSGTKVVSVRTPKRPTAPAAVTESPGNWTHPRLREINRRRNRTTFTDKNIRKIAYNIAALIGLWVLQWAAESVSDRFLGPDSLRRETKNMCSWAYLLVQTLPFINIGIALLPLFRTEDNISDIPLTPGQRKLLGLPPSSAPPTPNAVYSTPPRYSRTPSMSGSIASKASFSGSPLSARGSVNKAAQQSTGSPYSPAASPLNGKSGFNPSLNGNGRRSSFGSPSPLPNSGSLFSEPATPSPSTKKTSVGLNNKWLYEKGRRSSGSWMQ
ncbi:hypothetical protein jhhlp_006551 [Lomentospora prolificans]|uniref:Nuclear pore complex component n=1 Tax=Lomentospora prolificans TaxID=41688 RepID=A0A2N3N672_9PEZI|nr:hypothetical protein jhhlp_006551 [Lomentospora prolificans]